MAVRLLKLALGAAITVILALAVASDGFAGGQPSLVPGDVDCDGVANVIDGALLLQLDAALIKSLSCPANADVNGDGHRNSTDALLVLQFDAALTPSLIRMSLVVTEPGGVCDDDLLPSACDIPAGSSFRLAIVLNNAPAEGYIAWETHLFFGQLTYRPSPNPETEIVWPEAGLDVRGPPDPIDSVAHGALSSPEPPFAASHYVGNLVELAMGCPPQPESLELALLSYSAADIQGAAVNRPDTITVPAMTVGHRDLDVDGDGRPEHVPLAATLTVNCVAP